MVKFFRKSISLSDLRVSYNDRLSDFYLSSWQRGDSPLPMLLVRLFLSLIALSIFTWSLWSGASPYWLIFLTNWGLLLVTLLTLSGLMVSCCALFKKLPDGSDLPWYVSMYWVFYNMTVTVALTITCLYWILLYTPEVKEQQSPEQFWLDLSTHGFNSCVAFIEVILSRTPHRFLHIYQPFGVELWYVAFTGIYYAAGGTDSLGNPYIYALLDWRQPDQAGIKVIEATAGLIVLYIVLWGLSLCRDKLSIALIRTTSLSLPLTPPDRHSTGIV